MMGFVDVERRGLMEISMVRRMKMFDMGGGGKEGGSCVWERERERKKKRERERERWL